jgi:hypothetical protein
MNVAMWAPRSGNDCSSNLVRKDVRSWELLQYFATERFLYRRAQSPFSDRFILKGALLPQLVGGPSPASKSTSIEVWVGDRKLLHSLTILGQRS